MVTATQAMETMGAMGTKEAVGTSGAGESRSLTVLGRRYDTGEPVCVRTRGDRVEAVEPVWPRTAVNDWPWIAPGLFDLQINGYGGMWFGQTGMTVDDVARGVRPYLAHGVTRLCPTLITNGFEPLRNGFAVLRQACEQQRWLNDMVPGFHLEGPYLSGEDGPRGAHPKQHIRPADWDEFCRWQEAAGGRIRLVTIAPEVAGAIPFIHKAVASGVVIALGHTAAHRDQIQAAVDAGARLSTHLGNGSHGTLRRHPNYIWEQLGEPRLAASIISDGAHLPSSVVASIIRAKGLMQTIITCDAAGWAGCAPGRYSNELGTVDVLADGRIVVAGQDQILAGSGAATDACVLRAMDDAGVSFAQAVDMACRNPCRLLGYEEPGLRRGCRADLLVFRHPAKTRTGSEALSRGTPQGLEVLATICAGHLHYGELPKP